MKLRLFLALSASFLLAMAAACSRPGVDSEVKRYRHSDDGVPTNIDPLQAATVYSNQIVVSVYDTLYRYKYLARPYVLVPNLAAGMPEISDDGLTYTITLKPGVRFIDDEAFPDGKGREVTAHDVVYSLKRHFDPARVSQGRWLWDRKIEGLNQWMDAGADYDAAVPGLLAVDDHTVRVRLVKPFPQFMNTLAQGFAAIVPHEAVTAYGEGLGTRAVGSGPWKLERYTREQVRLVRNPDFRKEPLDLAYEGYDAALHGHLGIAHLDGKPSPFVDELWIDFIQESAARWASFTSGREIQMSGLPVEQTDIVLASKDPVALKPEYAQRYHLDTGPEAGLVFTVFNMADPDIGNVPDPQRNAMNRALRCAMRDAFDWQQRNDRFYSGLGEVFPGVIPPLLAEFDATLSRDSVTHNPERARARLAEAGWTADNLPTLDYGLVASVLGREMAEEFRGYMAAVGIPPEKINIKSYATFGDYNRALRTSELPIMGYGWGLDYPDAENVLQLFYGPNSAPGSNAANYRNPAYDALYEQSSVMLPSAARSEIYRQMNQMLIDDCVGILSLSRRRIALWHRDVLGLPDRQILGGFWLRFVDVK
ncbi:MAG: ABC transporter substrate-binding protein [Polycyclovorans sp.]|nr:ABC transporter substrate-binding protein [Polycyclovorans sp.]